VHTHARNDCPTTPCQAVMIIITEKEVGVKATKPTNMRETQGINIERKVSHGIGGFGNYRRPSDAPFPSKPSPERHHSSIWSKFTPSPGSSPSERRGSFLNVFRRNSISESIAPLVGEADLNVREGIENESRN